MSQTESPTTTEKCWRQIGAWGDQSCTELKTHLHCHNCPVYVDSGRHLFQQTAPPSYLDEWHEVLAQETAAADLQLQSVMVFRIGTEWMALDTIRLVEVHPLRPIHRVPHIRPTGFLGLVNLRGRLHLCLSLAKLFGLESAPQTTNGDETTSSERLVTLEKDGELWAATVDHVEGIFRFPPQDVQAPPVTVAKAASTFTKGVVAMGDRKLAWLDEELLFHHLKSNLF